MQRMTFSYIIICVVHGKFFRCIPINACWTLFCKTEPWSITLGPAYFFFLTFYCYSQILIWEFSNFSVGTSYLSSIHQTSLHYGPTNPMPHDSMLSMKSLASRSMPPWNYVCMYVCMYMSMCTYICIYMRPYHMRELVYYVCTYVSWPLDQN